MRAVCPSPRGLLRPQYVCASVDKAAGFRVASCCCSGARRWAALRAFALRSGRDGVVGFLPRYLEEQGLLKRRRRLLAGPSGQSGTPSPAQRPQQSLLGSAGAATVGLALWTRRAVRNRHFEPAPRQPRFCWSAFFLLDHTNVPPVLPRQPLANLAPLIGVLGVPSRSADKRPLLLWAPRRRAVLLSADGRCLWGSAIVAAVGDLTRTDKSKAVGRRGSCEQALNSSRGVSSSSRWAPLGPPPNFRKVPGR